MQVSHFGNIRFSVNNSVEQVHTAHHSVLMWHVSMWLLNWLLPWDVFLSPPSTVLFFFFFSVGLVSLTTHYIHHRDTFLIQKFSFNLKFTFTRIGTQGDRATCPQQFVATLKRKSEKTKQPLFVLCVNICTTSLDKQATLHFSYSKTLPWRHNQETPLFLWGQCSASCAKVNMASRQAILIFNRRTAEAVQLWYLLNTANGLHVWAACPVSLAACAD